MVKFLKTEILLIFCFLFIFWLIHPEIYAEPPQYSDQFRNSKKISANDEIYNPLNWIARGGCWDFSGRIISGQGYRGHNKAWYSAQDFSDFIYEVRLKKVSENGPLGLLFRYDEKKDVAYCLKYWPVGRIVLEIIGSGQDKIEKIKDQITPYRKQGLNIWTTIKIVAHGPRFEIYINGHLIDTILDNTLSMGKVGLYLHSGPRQRAQFEILQISIPENE